MMGWATAWSFDRLRLWCERDIPPEQLLRHALAESASRLSMVLVVAAVLGPVPAALSAVAAVLLPHLPCTPTARRCRRRPAAHPPGDPGAAMTSIFQRALGADFERLHPQLRRRFSVGLNTGQGCVGHGTMDRIWHGGTHLRPFLALGAARHILLPRAGHEVPFTIENMPYTDSFGRETVTFVRTFDFPGTEHRFDATMIYSPARGCIVDYLGTHQHLATELHLSVDDDGALLIRSGAHRFREHRVDVQVPPPLAGQAWVRESFDEGSGRFRISVRVINEWLGPLFGYEGSFTARYLTAGDTRLRPGLRPVREEARE
jgi:hypothetical protein